MTDSKATGMEQLSFMVGEWDIQAWTMGEQGEWVASPQPKQTVIESLFDGAFLREQEVLMQAGDRVLRFFIMWSYDPYRAVYRMLACDDHEGLMDILEGNPDGDTMIVSNLNTGTPMLDENGQPVYLRLESTQHDADSFTDQMFESSDAGANWQPVYRAAHTRKQVAA